VKSKNPFRIGRPVRGRFFTGHEPEVRRVQEALSTPGARLLVCGDRQVGKGSVLGEAQARLRADGHSSIVVRLSGATSVADMATRVLRAATAQLRKPWKKVGRELTTRLGPVATLAPDDRTGRGIPTLDRGLRAAPVEAQRETLGAVLHALNAFAVDRRAQLGIALDDFPELLRFGGTDAEWHLRGVIRRHENVSYVLAGGTEALAAELTADGRAFQTMFEQLTVLPLEQDELSRWIDARIKRTGVKCQRGFGKRIVELAGPTTGDVIRLARQAFLHAQGGGKLRRRDVPALADDVVDGLDELIRAEWSLLTARQQNLMCALAAGELQPFAERVRRLYDLRSSAAVARTLELLIQKGLVARSDGGYGLVNPYRRRWIERHALPDLGMVAG